MAGYLRKQSPLIPSVRPEDSIIIGICGDPKGFKTFTLHSKSSSEGIKEDKNTLLKISIK